jgi:hypothetical protein
VTCHHAGCPEDAKAAMAASLLLIVRMLLEGVLCE